MPTILTALSSALIVKKLGMQVYFGVSAAIRWAVAGLVLGALLAHGDQANAAVRFENFTGAPMTVQYAGGGHSVASGAFVSLDYDDAAFSVVTVDGEAAASVLDYSRVRVAPLGAVDVEASAQTYLEFFMKGFWLGFGFELVGVVYRLVLSMRKTSVL